MGDKLEESATSEAWVPGNDPALYDEAHFHHLLRVERMRAERSGTPFFLMLVDVSMLMVRWHPGGTMRRICAVMEASLREMDVRGWYDHACVIGIIFTETGVPEETFGAVIRGKIKDRFREQFEPDWIDKISMTCYRFPEKSSAEASASRPSQPSSYQPIFGFGR